MLRMFRRTPPPPQKKEKRNDPATSGDDVLSPFCSFCIDKVLNQDHKQTEQQCINQHRPALVLL